MDPTPLGFRRTGNEAAKEMKLELIPNLAFGHYLHWIQLAELEKQEKLALNGCSALHWTTTQATAHRSSSCN